MIETLRSFFSYLAYARETNKRNPWFWSIREVYWDHFPSAFDRWYDKRTRI